MKKAAYLGFPPPLLGMQAVRLPVFFDDGEMLLLAKPPGILVQQDTWYPRLPVLVEAIRYQAAHGKPEFRKQGISPEGLWAVTDLDPECHGPVLFARSRDRADALRNAYGSGAFSFEFEFLTRNEPPSGPLGCDLPLARHVREGRMLVSHSTGKRSHTSFSLIRPVGRWFLASAHTAYPRRHQVLVHAMELGLPVVGDKRYATIRPPMLSSLKRGYRPPKDREEGPLYDGPAYFLRQLCIPSHGAVQTPPPRKWDALLKQVARHS